MNRYDYRARFTELTGMHYNHPSYVPWLEEQIKKLEKDPNNEKSKAAYRPRAF